METINKIKEYFFNTAEQGININPEYYKQTVSFLFECEREENVSKNDSNCNLPQVSKSLPTDTEMIDWIQMILTPKENYCEVFFAGLRSGNNDAEDYQIESNPERFKTLQAKNIREAIFEAMLEYKKKGNVC